jgi:pimeloyl-ACP methyl ester carboxylesterase
MMDIKEKILLGGVFQKIHIKTMDERLPVLLFLHGGPGVVNRHAIMTAHKDLLDTFTIVGWDQRGSGGSYKGVPIECLTIRQFVDDAAELVKHLCQRLKKDKIFIIGGSWGSELGTLLAYRYPKHIAAYVGFGQVVNGEKNEEISYQFALDAAKNAGDLDSVSILEKLGPPVRGIYEGGFSGMMTQRRIMMKYGGYSPNEKRKSYFSSIVKPMFLSGEYSISDLIGAAKGYKKVLTATLEEVGLTDLARDCPEQTVPYFIFDGVFDNNTPASLVEEYYKRIKAPQKELIWFEKSGHNPMSDEPEKFKGLLREKLSHIAQEERDRGIRI